MTKTKRPSFGDILLLLSDDDKNKLNKNDPDYYIEYFWYGFKISMNNFYNQNNINCNHIQEWSNNLNNLKESKEYNQIEFYIRDYMAKYSMDIIKYSPLTSIYHDEILITNIKRWEKVSEQFNFEKSSEYNKLLLLFMIFLELKKDNLSHKFLENQILLLENIIKNNNFDNFIIYSLNNEKTKILELLKLIPEYDLLFNIKKLFPLLNINSRTKNIKMLKICIMHKKYYLSLNNE